MGRKEDKNTAMNRRKGEGKERVDAEEEKGSWKEGS